MNALLLVMVLMMALTAGLPGRAFAAAQWTIMVYMDGDNNLEGAALDDFLEIASIGSSAGVNIVVQLDRIPGYDSSYGNWTTTKRFYVTRGMTPDPGNALADLGELNMGDPATLTNFINWATSAYPANNYALILWNHGGGWRERQDTLRKALTEAKEGAEQKAIQEAIQKELDAITKPAPIFKEVCSDATNNDVLYTKEVKAALDAANTHVHLIGFDACLMSMIEVAYELRNTGPSVMVGSEETEPGDGWPYNLIIDGLTKNPSWTPAQLASFIVDKYYESYNNNNTQSALDLTRMNTLAAKVSNLATATRTGWNSDRQGVQNAAREVITELNNTVIRERHGTGWPGAKGLAIYFPTSQGGFSTEYNASVIDFAGNTTWDEFLQSYYQNMTSSWIAAARQQSQHFYISDHIDLYDYCSRLINAQPTGQNYTVSQTTYTFEDISNTGTGLNMTDDSFEHFTIPFSFSFYGANYNEISVGSNGVVYFANVYLGMNHTSIPANNSYGVTTFMAPFWDDLNPGAGGRVYYEIKGSAPNRRLIVQWNNVPRYYNIGAATFQAVLYETSGNIEFRYRDVMFENSSYDKGASATVGIQQNSITGLQYSYNTAALSNSLALLFQPPTAQAVGYTVSNASYSFEDISTGGTNLNLTDDSFVRFSIPFTAKFYGIGYNEVSVSSNGVVYFANTNMTYSNSEIPGTNSAGVTAIMAPFWDDLNPSAGGWVYYAVKGSAPNRRLIVQWHQVPHYSNIGAATFQAVLYETSGNIEFRYRDVMFENSSYDKGASATVGLQKDAATGIQCSYNTASVNNQTAKLFVPIGGSIAATSGSIAPILNFMLLDD